MGVTLSQMQLGYKSWVVCKQSPRKPGLQKNKITAQPKQSEAARRLVESLQPELTQIKWSKHEKVGARTSRRKQTGRNLKLASPVETCPESHHSNLNWLFMWKGHSVKHTLGRCQWQASLRGSKTLRLARKQTVRIQGDTTHCQTLQQTLEIHIPALKTCNQDSGNLMGVKWQPAPKT